MLIDIKPIVHIVDDDSHMQESLLTLAASASLMAIAYSSAEQFLAESSTECPGCVVLELRLPGLTGMHLLEQLRREKAHIPVILHSAHADVPATVRAMKLGAIDLLEKPVDPAALLNSVRCGLELSRARVREREETKITRGRFERLTVREMELVPMIVEGRANKQIASSLGISIKTVAIHRANLMAKSGAINAADLARLFTLINYQSCSCTFPPSVGVWSR